MPTIELEALVLDENMSRKDKIEAIANRGCFADTAEACVAWNILMELMFEMASGESAATPKFNDLLKAIWTATVKARLLKATILSNTAPVFTAAEANKTTPLPQTSGQP